MKRKFFIFLSSFILSIVFIIASSPFVSAYTYVEDYTSISSPISQPTVSDYFAYVEVVCKNDSPYTLRGYVFLISFFETSNPSCRLEFGSDKNIKFFNGSDGIMSVYCVTSGNRYYSQGQALVQGAYVQESFDFSIVSVKYYGCVFSNQASQYNTSPIVTTYGSDSKSILLLQTIVDVLRANSSSVSQIIQNDNANTDKLINAGSDKGQPDFGSTNGKLDDTVGQIESIEGSYQIDQAATNTALSTGSSFLQGSDMQRASIQVKTWIERFSSENRVVTGFLIAAMVLGLCFWVIGRKAWSK